MDSNETIPNISIDLVKKLALARLQFLIKRPDLIIVDDSGENRVFAAWRSLILVSGPQLRITLKVYFRLATAQALAAPVFRTDPKGVHKDQAIDFIREYCNLTAGGIKLALSDLGFQTGISLPIVTRGFDEIFFHLDGALGKIFHWEICGDDVRLPISCFIETLDAGFPSLAVEKFNSEGNE